MALTLLDISIALTIGIIVGIVLQRGRVCTNTAFRNLLLIRNSELFLVIITTVMVEIIGYQLLILLPIPEFSFESNPIPFSIVLIPLGGFIFGIGTVIAGGCAGGVCYRIGEGSLKSLLAFLGFAIGIGVFSINPLFGVVTELRNSTTLLIGGNIPSLEAFLPRWIWSSVSLFLLLGTIYYYRIQTPKLTHLRPHWTPVISGALLGFLGVLARYSSTLTGRPFGFSTTDGIGEIFSTFANFIGFNSPFTIQWAGLFIIGLIFGAALSSIQIREFQVKLPNKYDTLRFFGGGILLGTGAILAQGCNFGHIFGGIPELGFSSFFALLFMIVGNWFGSYMVYTVGKQDLPESTPIM